MSISAAWSYFYFFFSFEYFTFIDKINSFKTDHWIQVRNVEKHFYSFYNQNAPLASSSQLNCLLHAAVPYLAISVWRSSLF